MEGENVRINIETENPETRAEKIRNAEIVVKNMFDARGDAVSIVRENPKVSDQSERES